MKISGFQKTSLIEYPGKIVSIIFTQGCNFKCPYCHNSDLISSESFTREYFPLDYIFSFLRKRKGLIDGISITGGEPTLQAGLYDFLTEIKDMNLCVKLDTNGSNPELIKLLIKDNLIDYIAMDIKGPLDKYEEITGAKIKAETIYTSISLIQNSGIDYEFRTTVVPGIHDKEDLQDIALLIKGDNQYFIQNFRANNTYNPDLMKLNGFPPAVLEEFKDIACSYIKKVELRD